MVPQRAGDKREQTDEGRRLAKESPEYCKQEQRIKSLASFAIYAYLPNAVENIWSQKNLQ